MYIYICHETGTVRRFEHGSVINEEPSKEICRLLSVPQSLFCLMKGNEAVEPSIRSASWWWGNTTQGSLRDEYICGKLKALLSKTE